jgi:hypothetical protein
MVFIPVRSPGIAVGWTILPRMPIQGYFGTLDRPPIIGPTASRGPRAATAIGGVTMTSDARVGDRIVLDSDKVGVPVRQGEILAITPHEPHAEFRVRWDDGHITEIRPGGASYRIVARERPVPAGR